MVVLSAGFLKTTKVSECFKTVYKMKTAISFLAHSLVILLLILFLAFCRSTRRIFMEPFNSF